MSRGLGYLQNYLLGDIIGPEPRTFADILDIALPPGSPKGDLARKVGAANVSITRSLRRPLFRLCEMGIVEMLGIKSPRSYRLNPVYEGCEYDPRLIAELHRIIKADVSSSNRS